MSMTIYSKLRGVTDLDLLSEALRAMKFTVIESGNSPPDSSRKKEVARTWIQNKQIRIVKNINSGELELVGDSDWRGILQDRAFKNKVKQQYSVAAVKRKVRVMNYQVSSVTTQEDGTIRLLATSWG